MRATGGSGMLEKDVKEVLFTAEEIRDRVAEMGKQIEKDYRGRDLLVIAVLKGANMFLGDLIRHIDLPMEVDFIAASSYGNTTESSGVVRILKDLDYPIEGKDVLLIEDLIDTGLTLHYLAENLKSRGPASFRICTLLDKPERRKIDIEVQYTGFAIPDEFIVGYGIDYSQRYRNLPYVATLKPEIYS
jgi:hypoxanthine phosphoribosyltransferase